MTIEFQMALIRSGTPKRSAAIHGDGLHTDDVECLQVICNEFANQGFLKFEVSGFGDPAWPVDVRTDLSVVVEQIGYVVQHLKEGLTCSLDFYEQGIERYIILTPESEKIRANCRCDLSWIPVPSEIVVSKTDFMVMLENFVTNFLQYTAILGSESLHARAKNTLIPSRD